MSRGSVTAVTPIGPGVDLALLRAALSSAVDSLGEGLQWRYACGPDQAEAVEAVVGSLDLEAAGIVTDSTNIAATRNLLTAMGTGDYLLALDADDTWVPGGLAQMRWVLDTRPEVVAAHGRAVNTAPDGVTVASVPPAWFNTFPDDTAAPGMLARRREKIAAAYRAWHDTGAFVAAYPVHPSAGLFRRGPVLAVGGWDENLGNYAEGLGLVAKLQRSYPWHLTHGTTVLAHRTHPHALSGRAMALSGSDFAVVNDILDAHETGQSLHAPAPPWEVPFVDRTPRPVLGPDGDTIEIPQLDPDEARPPMSLVEQFVTPLIERDPAAKSPAEYAAIEGRWAPGVDSEDYDDAAPDIDHDAELRKLLHLDDPGEGEK